MTIDEARVRDILRVLCRVPIPRGQLVLYKMALQSGTAGFTSNDMTSVSFAAGWGHPGQPRRGADPVSSTRAARHP